MTKLEKTLTTKVDNLNNKIKILQEQLELLRRDKFGQKREKLPVDLGDFLGLDFGKELIEDEDSNPVEMKTVKRPVKNRKKQDYAKFLKGLPREEEVFDLPEHEKEGLVCIGQDEFERLAVKPAQYYVKVRIIKKYVIAESPKAGVITAYLPKPAIPGSFFDESFYSKLLVMKFADHLPLYRLEGIFNRDGLNLSRQTMSKTILRLADILKPLVARLRTVIIESQRVFADETVVKMLQKEKCKTTYFWILVGDDEKCRQLKRSSEASPPLVYYQFFPDRKHENANTLLGDGYAGKLHSDAYGAYENLDTKGLIWQPCWAHARRKFFDATSAYPFRNEIIQLFDELFEQEKSYWEINLQDDWTDADKLKSKREHRETKCQPIVDAIFEKAKDFLFKGKWIRGEKIVKACEYLLSREQSFRNFLTHHDLRIDNNVSERNIRPLTIGRKNWMFVGNERGGEATGIVCSLIQTCRNLQINPQEYLEDVLCRINNTSSEDLDTLLPQNWKKNKIQ